MDKYRNDQDVKAVILDGMTECNPEEFGDLMVEGLTE